jgi:hypothetical protein
MKDDTLKIDLEQVKQGWRDWIKNLAPWETFITLTFDNDHQTYREGMEKRWRSLVQFLNRDLYGNHYVRMVGHSYFSYVAGFEYTTNNAIHMHAVIDKPYDFKALHRYWNHMSGFAQIQTTYDRRGAVDYLTKYVLKDNDLLFWKAGKPKQPAFAPLWYLEHTEKESMSVLSLPILNGV